MSGIGKGWESVSIFQKQDFSFFPLKCQGFILVLFCVMTSVMT